MAQSQPPAARVRMYRTGVGDCFLVTLTGRDVTSSKPFHLLIDCGTAERDAEARALMLRVAQDVARETGGRLNVVVATHPLWDHVGGFLLARDAFARMTIGEVWLAWTEAPGDALSGVLRERRQAAARGLRASAARMAAAGDDDAAERVRRVLDMFQVGGGPGAKAALDVLVTHPSRPRVSYHRPGGPPLALGEVSGACAYVLGPSLDLAALRGGPGRGDHAFATAASFFAAAVGGVSPDDADSLEQRHAFDKRYRLPPDRAEDFPIIDRYYAADGWRRADGDWLGAARQFTLELDAQFNNSSLALAIELTPGGDVLLFPGDAQAPTWRSWDAYRWHPGPSRERLVTAADLLARTVLYKVSHHGGPAGTPGPGGLNRMTDPRLVAMVPADPTAAARAGWGLPGGVLMDQLRRHTRGRVLLADGRVPDRPGDVVGAQWEAFTDRVGRDPGAPYLDYTIEPESRHLAQTWGTRYG